MAVKVNFTNRIKMYCSGFFSESAVLYDFINYPKSDYLTDIQRLNTEYLNGAKRIILDNKLLFGKVMPSSFNVPDNIIYIQRGKFFPLIDGFDSPKSLYESVMAGEEYVMKPIQGGGGEGVFFLEKIKGDFYINGTPSTVDLLQQHSHFSPRMLVCRKAQQSAFCKSLFPKSINTLRVLTGISPRTGEVIIMSAIQRIGVSSSAPMDNVIRGGLSVALDLETGELGRGATYPLGRSQIFMTEKHPDTGKRFTGLLHPQWKQIAKTLKTELTNKTYPVYAGWDILAKDNGFSVIEGNNYSGVSVLQMHSPLLSKHENREFFKHHGII